jgi:hypothetical protein
MPQEIFADGVRSAGDLAGVFEYDGETGYFYLYRTNAVAGAKIADALPVVSGPIDFMADDISIRWDRSEMKVALFINSVMWAAFDCSSGQKLGGNYTTNGKPRIPADFTFVTSSRQ